jgi:hypothetical protein
MVPSRAPRLVQPERVLEMLNRRGERRDWLRGDEFEAGLRRLAQRLPNVWQGTVLDGELTTGVSREPWPPCSAQSYRVDLRFVVFDVPYLLGADLRGLPWQERRDRLELHAQAFEIPIELSPLVQPSVALTDGRRAARGDRPQGSNVELP